MTLPLKWWVYALGNFLIGKALPSFTSMLCSLTPYVMRTAVTLWSELIVTVYIFFRNVISPIFKSLQKGQIANALYFRPTIISISTVYHCWHSFTTTSLWFLQPSVNYSNRAKSLHVQPCLITLSKSDRKILGHNPLYLFVVIDRLLDWRDRNSALKTLKHWKVQFLL